MRIVLASGGLDSSLLLARAKQEAIPLYVDYGQKVIKNELCYLKGVARKYGTKDIMLEKTIADVEFQKNDIVIKDRNLALLSTALFAALVVGVEEIQIGCCKDDQELFEDCRQEFIDVFNYVLKEAGSNIFVSAPLINMSKEEIWKEFLILGGSEEDVFTCYENVYGNCGECYSCQKTFEALKNVYNSKDF